MVDAHKCDSKDTSEEYDEEEVWAVMKGRKEEDFKTWKTCTTKQSKPTATTTKNEHRMISMSNNGDMGLRHQSAPVNVPNWSSLVRHGEDDHGVPQEEDEDRVPPHEWIAKKIMRSQMTSFSVFEGRGRTLKGRDLSKVRDGILYKTGFIE